MGWLFMPRSSLGPHRSAKEYLDDQFTFERSLEGGGSRGLRVIASSCLRNRVWYAAAQKMSDGVGGDVAALVRLLKWNPGDEEGLIFGYNDMDETMGPYEADCPARILDLLTATDNDNARLRREHCRENIKKCHRTLADGDRILLPEPITFTDGDQGAEFVVEKIGRRLVLRDPQSNLAYRISRLMERPWTNVPVTKVHRTLFA